MNPVSISRRDLHNTPPFFLPRAGFTMSPEEDNLRKRSGRVLPGSACLS
jgi:hypothetical protein